MARVSRLSERQAISALSRGATIEQSLSVDLGEGTFRWVSARPTSTGYELREHHVRDDGSDDFLDVYEFRPVDEDEHPGEGRITGEFTDVASLLGAAHAIGAGVSAWVIVGGVQEQYAYLRETSQ